MQTQTDHQLPASFQFVTEEPTLEKVLSEKCFIDAFRAFLRSEFSDENIEFWLACQDYKEARSPTELSSKAKEIYNEFVDPHALKEINIDCHIRETIEMALQEPDFSCFDEAQKHIYSVMEKDSWPRFLKSDVYLNLVHKSQTEDGNKKGQEYWWHDA
ncbi:RGS4 protein, partial [Amia calva]|nr:RGS4 protein [Amia calva]